MGYLYEKKQLVENTNRIPQQMSPLRYPVQAL